MYPYNDQPRLENIFNFIWRCAIAIGLFYIFKEIKYIADVITGYVKMILQSGSF